MFCGICCSLMYAAMNFCYNFIMNIFITGINHGCGKTLIAAGITAVLQSLGYRTCVYKPVQTGAVDRGKYIVSPDLKFVRKLDPNILTHATYLLTSNTVPAAASQIEQVAINIEDIENDYGILSQNTEILIVEGTGGLLTPINTDTFNLHIPLTLKLPVVFVVNPSNDSLNSYLNELSTARKAGLEVLGVIINKYPAQPKTEDIETFPSLLEHYSCVKVLGIIHYLKNNKNIKADELFTEILNGINIQEILKMEIPKLNLDY